MMQWLFQLWFSICLLSFIFNKWSFQYHFSYVIVAKIISKTASVIALNNVEHEGFYLSCMICFLITEIISTIQSGMFIHYDYKWVNSLLILLSITYVMLGCLSRLCRVILLLIFFSLTAWTFFIIFDKS